MKVFCITINSFSLIPVTRYIISLYGKRFHTEVIECTISGQYVIRAVKKNTNIRRFKGARDLNTQSLLFKLWKYIVIVWKISFLIFKKDIILYTPDFQVLSYVVWVKKRFKRIHWRVIYHQFELVEDKYLQKRDKKLWHYILKNIRLINLSIFPEIHRLQYFINISQQPVNNTLLFPNTCEGQLDVTKIKHPALSDIPDTAIICAHIGNVGINHYFQEFISIIEACSSHENIYFVIAGQFSEDVMSEYRRIESNKLILLGELPHSDLKTIYPFVDYGFILYKEIDLNFKYCAPNKLYEYWSYGISVIAHVLTGLKELFNNPVKGKLIDFNKSDFYADVMSLLLSGKQKKEELKRIFGKEMDINKELLKLENKILSI